MDLGRVRLGQTLDLFLATENSAGAVAQPDDVPSLSVFDPVGTKILTARMPVWSTLGDKTVFHYPLFLGPLFTTPGRYVILYNYNVGSFFGVEEEDFTVVAGGTDKGASLAMYFFRRPQADFLIQQKESGQVARGKNPSI